MPVIRTKRNSQTRRTEPLARLAMLVALMSAPWGRGTSLPSEPAPVADWVLLPDYRLPFDAGGPIGPRIPLPYVPAALELPLPVLHLQGEPASRQWEPPLDPRLLQGDRFAVEMLFHDHTDLPVGAGAFLRSADGAPVWALVYRYRIVTWTAFEDGKALPVLERRSEWRSAFDRYWRHVVLSADRGLATLWYNGERVGQSAMPRAAADSVLRLVLSAFTRAEPQMKLEDLVHRVRIYSRPLEEPAVRARFEELTGEVHRGVVYPGIFHFNAGPILSHVTAESATMVFETDRPTTAVVEYGPALPGNLKAAGGELRTLHQVRLSGLSPSSNYYYRVTARDGDHREIHSGDLTFRTAPRRGEPVTFAVIGDTEARPHVNHQLAKWIWDQRPQFTVNLGDLTDGGVKARKPDWNLEYFLAFTPLHGRIPILAVPGNGEWGNRELFWYQQYMAAPVDQGNGPGYYRFGCGDAEFFMLDSNPRESDFKPGGLQYVWLEEGLARSTARWKFVCHHHPAYTSSAGGSFVGKETVLADPLIQPMTALYERYGVQLVLAGHIHHYERSHPIRGGKLNPGGVIYITSGGGGGNLQDFAPTRSWFTAMSHVGYHLCTATIDGGRLELRMYDINGALRDRVELSR